MVRLDLDDTKLNSIQKNSLQDHNILMVVLVPNRTRLLQGFSQSSAGIVPHPHPTAPTGCDTYPYPLISLNQTLTQASVRIGLYVRVGELQEFSTL